MTDAPDPSPSSSDDGDRPSFPRLAARTLGFTLGVPRDITVSPDGSRVVFLRSPSGTSRAGALWVLDVETGEERVVADPAALLGESGEDLSPDERARRERSRESRGGIVAYATDAACEQATFALSGRLFVVGLTEDDRVRELPSAPGVIDPRLGPDGYNVAYAAGRALRLVGSDGLLDRALVEPDGDHVVWGRAEFVAAEEMERYRGFWWAPDASGLLVERYDESAVGVWHVADPADPAAEPVAHRYPAAGTADADVSLWHVGIDGGRTEIAWDRAAFPYLTRVSWTSHGRPLAQVMSRDQRHALVLAVDVATGATETVLEQTDDVWVDLVAGVPAYAPGGRLVTTVDSDDTRRVAVDGEPISPVGLQVRGVVTVDDDGVLVTASTDPRGTDLVLVGWDGAVVRTTASLTVDAPEGLGVHSGLSAGGTTVVASSTLGPATTRVWAFRDGLTRELVSHQEPAPHVPDVRWLRAGDDEIVTAVLLPRDHAPGSSRLPVVMDPYGGPHGQVAVASSRAFLRAQWLADQGFAVVVADGRGTPARGPAWERAIRDDFVGATLDDQVVALEAACEAFPDDLDRSRVGMRGWSYGGYLSALAVLRRPDVFAAAVAGAPVTDWRLYDTYYTERYLGHPDDQPEVYDRNSLIGLAPGLERPLLIIHGMVDDNVVVAHTLRLSSALLAAGRPHSVLPLTGVTHMTPQEVVAENLQLVQVDFLRTHLG